MTLWPHARAVTDEETFEVPDDLEKLDRGQLVGIATVAGIPIGDGPSPAELCNRIRHASV